VKKKAGFPLGFQVALIVLSGCSVLALAIVQYGGMVYGRMLEEQFSAKIVTLGENCAYMLEPFIKAIMLDKKNKDKTIPAGVKTEIARILEAAVTREDMKYAAFFYRGKLAAEINAEGRVNFKLPETEKLEETMMDYPLARINDGSGNSYELSIPIMYLGDELGAVRIGFDKSSLVLQSEQTRNTMLLIGIIGTLVTAIGIAVYLYIHMVKHIKEISRSALKIGRGELGGSVTVIKSNDEIGVLTKSFEKVSEYFTEIAAIADNISEGIVAEKFEAKSENDMLGASFARMINYINSVSGILDSISKGDLGVVYKARSEKDALGKASEKMIESLRQLVGNIKEKSDMIATSAEQLAQISEQSRLTIVQLSETVANISQATSETARNSQVASGSAAKAETEAKKGQERMGELLDNMQKLQNDVQNSASRMEALAGHSEEIKKMVEIIQNIADQTKLLSFNAAIEAARAGDSGRGFAVVADEIRSLSEMSTEQAKKIALRIKQVRDDIKTAVELAGASNAEILQGSKLTEETHTIFQEIVASMNEAASQIESIAASSEEIAASSEEAAASSQEQASTMDELNASVETLSEIAVNLKLSTDEFRL